MGQRIYYLTGRGGRLHEGLGAALLTLGLDVVGREMHGAFGQMRFSQQVSAVAGDLQAHHWDSRSLVVANSFGAYLFLHAQAEMPPYVGRVLLLSPIVGEAHNQAQAVGFVPPRAGMLHELAMVGKYPVPFDCQMHVGSDDWQARPERVKELGQLLGIPVHVVPNSGHMLGKNYVRALIEGWVIDTTLSGCSLATTSSQSA